jgi:hypothetical protein
MVKDVVKDVGIVAINQGRPLLNHKAEGTNTEREAGDGEWKLMVTVK